MTNTDKMTNRKAIQFVLNNCEIPADVREKFEAMIVALDKKSGTERKPSAHQIENENIKAKMVDTMEANTLYDIQTMLKTFDCFDENFTSQRVSALLTQLIAEGKVVKTMDKRKAYFSLA